MVGQLGHVMKEEPKKQKFEVKQYFDDLSGNLRKDVFVDEKLFEYEIDRNSLAKAKQMGPQFYIAAQKDIQKHFLDSLSDFLGRKITSQEVQEAIKTGWI